MAQNQFFHGGHSIFESQDRLSGEESDPGEKNNLLGDELRSEGHSRGQLGVYSGGLRLRRWCNALHLVNNIMFWLASCFVIAACTVYIVSSYLSVSQRCDDRYSQIDSSTSNIVENDRGMDWVSLASEPNGLVPKFEAQVVTFWNDSFFVPSEKILGGMPLELLSPQIEAAWSSIIPHHPENHILPLQMEDRDGNKINTYGISVFHQLHCLFLILRSWVAYHHNADQDNEASHLLHCFDFIRLELMCVADTTLEGADVFSIAMGKKNATIGLGSQHVCKDWDALYGWVLDHETNTTKSNIGGHHKHTG